MSDNLKSWPERIWLQAGYEGDTPEYPPHSTEDVTWCEHAQETGDIEYIRADTVACNNFAQPVAPVVDDREAFASHFNLDLNYEGGSGHNDQIWHKWQGWQARAALSPQPKALTDDEDLHCHLDNLRAMPHAQALEKLRALLEGAK